MESLDLAIQAEQLTKRYDTITALDHISFEVRAGEIMGFLGPNGAGKTTALKILTGLLTPTEGSVRINGLDVESRSLEIRRQIGYLPENVSLYPELRVQEYLDYRACIKGVPRRGRRGRVDEVMDRCAVADVRRRLIGRLSKGYRQRIALADCLLGQPSILILDEPTVGLDPHQIRQARDLIRSLGESATILLSTHILPEVEMTCQRVTIINKGAIVAVDTPENLRQRLSGPPVIRTEIRGDAAAIEQGLKQLPGVRHIDSHGAGPSGFHLFDVHSGTDVREAIFQLAVAQRWTLRQLAQTQASLEDVFIHLTTQEKE
ncbi:MAG: ABC transporter ATP-binding protein [Candidatus Omnitrophica bacterium]|nr:ABC transporter ATP-binding protein [Candidatus Omnitrophota bacterium]